MKQLSIIISISFGTLSFGQFFEETQEYIDNHEKQEVRFFSNDLNTENSIYSNDNFNMNPSTNQEVDGGPTSPGQQVPLDNGLLFLSFTAIIMGTYFLRRKEKIK